MRSTLGAGATKHWKPSTENPSAYVKYSFTEANGTLLVRRRGLRLTGFPDVLIHPISFFRSGSPPVAACLRVMLRYQMVYVNSLIPLDLHIKEAYYAT